jgi:hypothetical protein
VCDVLLNYKKSFHEFFKNKKKNHKTRIKATQPSGGYFLVVFFRGFTKQNIACRALA